jgi:hypothetical protein
MGKTATLAEVKAAQAFLRTLGADWHNQDIIRGVVAWFHQESGSISKVLGNNPFNIRIDSAAIGYRITKSNGKFAIFKTLEEGFQAAAGLLLRGMGDKGDARGYGLVVRAARHGVILDFLQAIAMSKWDAAHYGYTPEHPENNHLLAAYNAITGLTLPVPPAPKPKKRRLPQQPRDIPRPFVPSPYMDAGAVGRSYRERHRNPMGNVALDRPRGL